jgi:hypothetical protein
MSLYDLVEPVAEAPAVRGAHLCVGAVRIASTDQFVVLMQDALWPARRAEGCLVEPEVGDSVLLLATEPESLFILNVIERANRTPVLLTHAEGIRLQAPTIAVVATETLSARAPRAEFDILHLTLRSAAATLVTRVASVLAESLRTVAVKIEQAAETLVTQTTHRTTVVGGIDTLDARAANTKIETDLVIRTGSTVLTAEQDVRMDAERISLA